MAWNERRGLYVRDVRFPLGFMRQRSQAPTGMHGHDFSELVFVLGGTAVHALRAAEDVEEVDRIATGDIFVIPSGMVHAYREVHGLSIVNVLFDLQGLGLPGWDVADTAAHLRLFDPLYRFPDRQFEGRLMHVEGQAWDRLMALLDKLEAAMATDDVGWQMVCGGLFAQVVGLLCRHYEDWRRHPGERPQWLQDTIGYIHDTFAERMTLKTLARKAGMSTSGFSHAFKSALGCPPIEYLLSYRVQRAAEMLRDTDEAVTGIAFAVGFSDSNYFSRQFRRRMGMPPREYRAHYRVLEQASRFLGTACLWPDQ